MLKKLLFIYNSKAGKANLKSSVADIIDIFTKAGYSVTAHPTQTTGDAYLVAKEYAGSFDMIVCAGGDGTLGEVSSGVYSSGSQVTMGYIPAGSTNDFAASISLPKSPTAAAKNIVNGKPHFFDLGKFNERHFIYVAAFGWFTDVSYSTDQNLKNMLGHTAYILEAGKRLFKMPEYKITVKTDDSEFTESIVYGMISNTRSVGGLKDFAWKDVDMDDGLFEVTLAKTPQNILELSEAVTSLLNTEPCDKIIRFKTSHIELYSEEEIKWTIDGEEAEAGTAFVADNLHNALKIMVKRDNTK